MTPEGVPGMRILGEDQRRSVMNILNASIRSSHPRRIPWEILWRWTRLANRPVPPSPSSGEALGAAHLLALGFLSET